jgi:hypothetical protein
MVKYLNSHNSSFALIPKVNGKATVWHTPCLFIFYSPSNHNGRPYLTSLWHHQVKLNGRGRSGVSAAQHWVIGPRTFSWSKGLHKGLYQWALTPGTSVAGLNFELATRTEPTYI